MKHQSEYKTTFEMLFRVDNFIRLVGASLIYLQVATKKFPVSTITNEYIGVIQSDVFIILLGVAAMIVVPDLRKYLMNKFGGEK